MGRRRRNREQLIEEVTAEWNRLSNTQKIAIIGVAPDIYFAVAWLAAHETVRKEHSWLGRS